jgi:hypothetical protein
MIFTFSINAQKIGDSDERVQTAPREINFPRKGRWSRAMADAARLRRDQVPGHLRHHLAKFIRLVTCAAQNGCHHLVRQKIVERCPGAEAFGAPKFMGLVNRERQIRYRFRDNPRSFNPSWQIGEIPNPAWIEAERVGLDPKTEADLAAGNRVRSRNPGQPRESKR